MGVPVLAARVQDELVRSQHTSVAHLDPQVAICVCVCVIHNEIHNNT